MLPRVIVVPIGIALAFLGGFTVHVVTDLSPTCRAVERGESPPGEHPCYEGSKAHRNFQAALGAGGGGLLALTLVPALAYALRGKGLLWLMMPIGGGLLLLLSAFIVGRV